MESSVFVAGGRHFYTSNSVVDVQSICLADVGDGRACRVIGPDAQINKYSSANTFKSPLLVSSSDFSFVGGQGREERLGVVLLVYNCRAGIDIVDNCVAVTNSGSSIPRMLRSSLWFNIIK